MSNQHRSPPNTYLGDVYWWGDDFYGSYKWMCQDLLGIFPKPPNPDHKFLDTNEHSVEHLWEFFEEEKMDNGMLALVLFSDTDWHTLSLATIETKFRYGDDIPDEDFIRLIVDFVEYVKGLPLGDPDAREGATWTDEDIERGYCEAENEKYRKAHEQFDKAFAEAQRTLFGDPDDEPEF